METAGRQTNPGTLQWLWHKREITLYKVPFLPSRKRDVMFITNQVYDSTWGKLNLNSFLLTNLGPVHDAKWNNQMKSNKSQCPLQQAW